VNGRGIPRLRFRVLGAALAAIFCLPALHPSPALAESRFEISGPEGEPVPGGRIVPYGTVLDVTYVLDDGEGSYRILWFGNNGGYRHYNPIDPAENRFTDTLDTSYDYGRHSGAPFFLYYMEISKSIDGEERILASETIWILNPTPNYPDAIEVLNQPTLGQDGAVRYRVAFTEDLLAGRRPSDFDVYLVRLGGTVLDGTPIEEAVGNITPNGLRAESEVGTYALSSLDPGLYELRLARDDRAAAYGTARFEVPSDEAALPAFPVPEPPVLLDAGITREVKLPNGDTYPLGDAIPIEVEWIKDNPESPDLGDTVPVHIAQALESDRDALQVWQAAQRELLQRQRIDLVTPPSIPMDCISQENGYFLGGLEMERLDPNRYVTEIETVRDGRVELGVGLHQIVVFGHNDHEQAPVVFGDPIVDLVPFTVLPPDGQGLLAVSLIGASDGDYRYEVSLTRPLPPGVARAFDPSRWPRIKLVRLPTKTAGGGFIPEYAVEERAIQDDETATFSLPARWETGDFEFRLIAAYPCHFGMCENVILDRVAMPTPVAPAGELARDWVPAYAILKDRVRLDPASRGVVQPWPAAAVPLVLCGEEPPPPEANYQPPPWLAMEAASYPREPQPGLPITAVFRVENKSDLPAAAVWVDLELVDPKTGRAPEDLDHLGELCEPADVGRFTCVLGDMEPGETADLEFLARTPMSGVVFWLAALGSAGDLGGMVDRGGIFGQPAPPHIVDVVVMADQTGIENGVPLFPYPFGPNSRGRQSRYLMVVGFNLPTRAQQPWPLPDAETINYVFLAYQDSDNPIYREWFASGWMQYYELEDPAAAVARADADGLEALLIRADLLEGILPGQHTVTVSTARGHWALEFGDIAARIAYIRELPGDEFDILKTAYFPERIRLAVELNMPLPVDEIPVYLSAEGLNGGQVDEIALTAGRSVLGDGRVYVTKPLDLHDHRKSAVLPGGLALAVQPQGSDPNLLKARIDPSFIFKTFRVPIDPLAAELTVGQSPAKGKFNWLWRDALRRAALCHDDIDVQDWTALSLAESEEIWNLMILTTSDHFPGQSVLFGHHAASILLRDMFLALMEKQLEKLEIIRANRQATRGLLAYLKTRTSDDTVLLNRMEVKDFDGGETEFRYLIMNDLDWLAEQNGASEAAILAWQMQETGAAIDRMLEAAREAIEQAEDAGDCDVEELILLTGFNFEPVAHLLKAELMRLDDVTVGGSPPRQLWQPNLVARQWIDRVAPLAAAVRLQQFKARVDTDMTLAAVTFVAMPFMLAEGTVVALVMLTLDARILAVTTVHELTQYFDSEAELDFALGASLVIGSGRYETALANAKGWASTTFAIGTAAFGLVGSTVGVVPKLSLAFRMARGRHLVNTLHSAAQIDMLRPVDLQDFGAFVVHARAQADAMDVGRLAAAERRSLELIEEYRALHAATRPLGEPDLPPANLADSFTPSSSVRFDVDPNTGIGAPRPPAGGRIETPRSSGEVPNALETRVPDNTHLPFRAADGSEHELPLGERLGGGYTSEVFAHADDPGLAIRVTYLKDGAPAATLDRFGRTALETGAQSEHVRAVRQITSYDVASGEFRGGTVTRVEVVERVQETAEATIARQGGRMSVAQMMAYEGALRHLNKKGLVWLDNKWDNFAFVPRGDGSGRVEVVVLDTGGIVPVKVNTDVPAPALAREIQLRINGDYASQIPDFAYIQRQDYRSVAREGWIQRHYAESFDYESLGIAGIDDLPFNAKSGEDFAYIAPLFEAVE